MSDVMAAPHIRILEAAAKLFISKGYQKTSTREICQIAEVNISAISYYYGDKQGLYREILKLVLENIPEQEFEWSEIINLPRKDKLLKLYQLTPLLTLEEQLKINAYQLVIMERMSPTGLVEDLFEELIRPRFSMVTKIINHELGITEAEFNYDAKILVLAITGLRLFFNQSFGLISQLLPSLLEDKPHADYLLLRLVDFADSLIETEIKRRKN